MIACTVPFCYLTPVDFKELWSEQQQQRLLVALDHQYWSPQSGNGKISG